MSNIHNWIVESFWREWVGGDTENCYLEIAFSFVRPSPWIVNWSTQNWKHKGKPSHYNTVEGIFKKYVKIRPNAKALELPNEMNCPHFLRLQYVGS